MGEVVTQTRPYKLVTGHCNYQQPYIKAGEGKATHTATLTYTAYSNFSTTAIRTMCIRINLYQGTCNP